MTAKEHVMLGVRSYDDRYNDQNTRNQGQEWCSRTVQTQSRPEVNLQESQLLLHLQSGDYVECGIEQDTEGLLCPEGPLGAHHHTGRSAAAWY